MFIERSINMNIQSINAYNSNPAFSSKLVPNNTLRDAFDHAKKTGNVKFLNSIKNILNDGKDNTVKIVSYRCPQNTDEYLKTSLFVNDMEKDFLDNQALPLFTDKKNISTGNRIVDSIKLIVRNFTDKKQVRGELDEIYKKYNLGKSDTRYLSDEPEFF